jgi:beta-glucosidase
MEQPIFERNIAMRSRTLFSAKGNTVLSALLCVASIALTQEPTPVYKDTGAATTVRVRDLLGRMTVEEKVAQLESGWTLPSLSGMSGTSLFSKNGVNEAEAKKLAGSGLGTYAFLDEFTSTGDARDPRMGAQRRNLLQAWVLKNTRLGIPIMFHGEALHGAVRPGATSFPEAVGLGSTWDPDLLQKVFTVAGRESRAAGNTMVLAPVLDLSRDPRYGRVEEMYSEDPYLVAKLATAAVRGLQGVNSDTDPLDQNHVYATLKHFVHGQPENGTNVGPNDFSERTMRSVFMYPFEQVVKNAHPAAVMPSYNENNGGIPSHANPWLLRQVLRGEWGFNGITASDYTAVSELASRHHVAADQPAAGVLALESGVDMELPTPSGFPGLVQAAKSGRIPMKDLDDAVGRVLTAKFRAGLFEHPYVDEERAAAEVGAKENIPLARQAADEAIVLLQNKSNILPLDPSKIKTLAVIGPNGNKERLGGYAALPAYYVTMLDGIQKRLGAGVKVVSAEGCHISEPDSGPNLNSMSIYKAPKPETDEKLLSEAVQAAQSADVIVLALGGNEVVSRESIGYGMIGDSDTLDLPGRQMDLVREIVKLGKPTVAVLLNGKAYAITELSDRVPGIVEGWYLGQETGNAIAGVLLGDVNPSGHLPISIPRNVGQLPVYYYKTPAARRGYVFGDNSPLFPFGLGLSYTTFAYGNPTLERNTIKPDETTHISVTVTNTGSRAGDTVVQMYVHHTVNIVVQPIIVLRGFKRIHLERGAGTLVTFEVGPEQLSILNAAMKRVVEPGKVEIRIGANSVETTSTPLNIAE